MAFDLLSVLSGRGYPTDTVTIYLDEALAQRIGKLRKRIADEKLSVEDMETVQSDLAAAVAEADKESLVIHGTGRARQVYRDAEKEARKLHPAGRNFAGQVELDDDFDEAFAARLWQAQITRIEYGDQANEKPTLKDIEVLRGNAPTWSLGQVETMLQGLRDAGAEFEIKSQSEDFS